jgi:hypothetical protein
MTRREQTGSNLQTENRICESYPWTTNERNHRPTVIFLRHRTGLTVDHVLWDCKETEQTKREMMMTPEICTRGAEGMKKLIEYTKNNPIPNQNYSKVHFLNPNPTRN